MRIGNDPGSTAEFTTTRVSLDVCVTCAADSPRTLPRSVEDAPFSKPRPVHGDAINPHCLDIGRSSQPHELLEPLPGIVAPQRVEPI